MAVGGLPCEGPLNQDQRGVGVVRVGATQEVGAGQVTGHEDWGLRYGLVAVPGGAHCNVGTAHDGRCPLDLILRG